MAKGQQQNPDWTWDEQILAFAVYLEYGAIGGSALDSAVWDEYGARPEVVRQLATSIREGSRIAIEAEDDELDIDQTHREGRISYRLHRRRERDPRVRARKRAAVRKKHGHLLCEACNVRLEDRYGTDAADVYECHHLMPLHVSGETITTVMDLALLCPTCHRVAHRIIPWPTLAQLQRLPKGA